MNQNEMMMVAGAFLIGFGIGNYLATRQATKALEGFQESFENAYENAKQNGNGEKSEPQPKPVVVDPNKVE